MTGNPGLIIPLGIGLLNCSALLVLRLVFGSGTQVESKAYNMLGTGSGLADSRGQKRGGASRFGLKFN